MDTKNILPCFCEAFCMSFSWHLNWPENGWSCEAHSQYLLYSCLCSNFSQLCAIVLLFQQKFLYLSSTAMVLKNTRLTHLSLAMCFTYASGLFPLQECLLNLKELYLSRNYFGSEGMKFLSKFTCCGTLSYPTVCSVQFKLEILNWVTGWLHYSVTSVLHQLSDNVSLPNTLHSGPLQWQCSYT